MAEPQTPRSSFPSREQYDAAAQKVSATAPPGLSKDEFYALIDKEIEANVATPSARAKPAAEEPSRWGFVRNAASDALRFGASYVHEGDKALEDPIGAIKALPAGIMSRIHHYQADIDPGAALEQLKHGRIGAAAGNMLPVGEFYKRPVQSATDIYAGAQIGRLGTAMARAGVRRPPAIPSGPPGAPPPPSPVRGTLVKPGQGVSRPGIIGQIEEELGKLQETPKEPGVELPPPPYSQGASAPPQQPRVSGIGPRPKPKPDLSGGGHTSVQPPHEFEANGMDMGDASSQPVKEGEATGGVDDAMYQEILRKLGGRSEEPPPVAEPAAVDEAAGPRFSDSMRSTEPPAEHMFGDMDRALASRDELDQASALHRGGAEMDARYSHLTDPESSGAVTDPAALMAKLFWQVLKDHVKEAAGREWSPGFVGQTGRYGTMVGKKLPATGAIMNLNRPEER